MHVNDWKEGANLPSKHNEFKVRFGSKETLLHSSALLCSADVHVLGKAGRGCEILLWTPCRRGAAATFERFNTGRSFRNPLKQLGDLTLHREGKFFECDYGWVFGAALQMTGIRSLNACRQRQIIL
jgi:hypothetical protein